LSDGANVFVSHIQEDEEHIAKMKTLLEKRGFRVRDSSITSERGNQARDESYIKGQILAPAIQWAGTVVVLISPDTKNSDWVNWEIEYAHQQGRRIVGVWTHGAADSDVPEALDRYADAVVGWNGDRIRDAIAGRINDWEGSDGRPHRERPIERHGC
jgi:hypothetical protein